MRIRSIVLLVLCFAALTASAVSAQSDDGIPDNCEYRYGQFYRPNLFPRYEPQNRRLLLVDWTTGAEVATLATDLDDTLIRAWSGDCRYLAVATGSAESRATAVYDTVDDRYIGEVPDAHLAPHPITWGPHDFLMVETRRGAVLWNVPENIQYPLAVGFNTTTYRNFDRLRWDADAYQMTGNLAVGGRIVVDMRTGGLTVAAGSAPGEIVLGGERFACVPTHGERGGSAVSGVTLNYAESGGVVSVSRGRGSYGETLQTLEGHVSPLTYSPASMWSVNCRYVAGSLISTERADRYDTVIWGVLEGRRVATIPDAHDVPHRLTWDAAEKHVLVETRNGAYIWDLATDTGVRVAAGVEAHFTNCAAQGCQPTSFHHVRWDAGRNQMLGVPVDAPNAVVAYDVATGQEVTRYTVEGAMEPLDFITSDNSRYILVYADRRLTLFDLTTGAASPVGASLSDYFRFSGNAAFSTDGRFLALIDCCGQLYVWDLNTAPASAAPAYTYQGVYANYLPVFFVNGDTLQLYSTKRINVVTGEHVGTWYSPYEQGFNANGQIRQSYTAVPGTSGNGVSNFWATSVTQCPIAVRYDADTRQILVHDLTSDGQRLVVANVNRVLNLHLSPDCRVIYAQIYQQDRSLSYDAAPVTGWGIYQYRFQADFYFWDAATGEQIAMIPSIRPHAFDYNNVVWNPDGTKALVHISPGGEYLLDNATRLLMPIQFHDTNGGALPPALNSYWDNSRGIVLVAGWGEVFAIDVQTGIERLRFPALQDQRGGCYWISDAYEGCGMNLSPDGTWVFVFGDSSMSAWNLDTLAHATLPVETGGDWAVHLGAQVSPDGRYLIVSRSAVRVWDLANLPESFDDRLPIATFGVGNRAVLSVRFVDDTIIEVVTRADGDSGTVTTRYDVRTGEPL